jgi:hypothetical protein
MIRTLAFCIQGLESYRREHQEIFVPQASKDISIIYFFFLESNLVCCINVDSVMEAPGQQYDTKEWSLFIDSSERSFKAVVLHNKINTLQLQQHMSFIF